MENFKKGHSGGIIKEVKRGSLKGPAIPENVLT